LLGLTTVSPLTTLRPLSITPPRLTTPNPATTQQQPIPPQLITLKLPSTTRLQATTLKPRFTLLHMPSQATTPMQHNTTLQLLIIPLRSPSTTQWKRPNTTLPLMLLSFTTLRLLNIRLQP
ncbi:Uncharacterized protein APZ42_008269, partial [Daphnia magna]